MPDAPLPLDVQARALGATQPNLLVWIGRAAVEAGRVEALASVGSELADRARQTREAVHAPIAWEDTGHDAWSRIRAALESSPDRAHLIEALSEYANDMHWAHTFLGLVAAEQGCLPEAGKHLIASSKVWGEPRLSSYGPSLLLARKLCEAGRWQDVEAFLLACGCFWDDESLADWLQEVRSE